MEISFQKWKNSVEDFVYHSTGYYLEDYPDEDYWNTWNEGHTPGYMANIVIENSNNEWY